MMLDRVPTTRGRAPAPRRPGGSGEAAVARIVLGALLVAGCADRGTGTAATVRDSAGIRIVEYPGPAAAPVWRLGDEPLLDLGVLEGDEARQFFQVSGAVRLADGAIVVANGGTQELRFFDAEGRILRRVGRQGEGPGEFQGMGNLALFAGGDSLGVYDWRLRRVSVYDAQGSFVRSFPLQFPQGAPAPIGAFDDGGWLAATGMVFGTGDVSEVRRDTTAYFVFAPDGALADSLFASPSWEFFVHGDAQFVMAQSLLFGRGFASAVFTDGFWAGVTDRYEIVRYTIQGDPRVILRMVRAARSVTPEDVDAAKAARLEGYRDPNARRRTERLFDEMPIPATMPAFASLSTDDAGRLWVADFAAPGDEQTGWTVFAPDGTLIARAATPLGFRETHVGVDFVLGTWTDDLGVEHVRLYELIREPET